MADNRNYLKKQGVEPTPVNLYMAHVAGMGGAVELNRAKQTNPNVPAADVLAQQYAQGKKFAGDPVKQQAAQSLHEKLLPNSMVLDYQGWGVKDVADLAQVEKGKEKFDYEVIKQGHWLLSLSPTILEKWFSRFTTFQHFLSI